MEASGRILRATIRLGGPSSDPVIGRGFNVTWEPPGNQEPEVRLDAASAASLGTFMESLRRGKIDVGMIREAAPALSSLLGTNRLSGAEFVQLSEDGSTTAITDIPWEAAARGSGPLPQDPTALFERLLASLPVWRIVPAGGPAPKIGDYRPRLLLCISNPPGVDGGQLAVGPIQTACEQALELYPVFQVKKLRGPLIWPSFDSIIPQFRPNVLIFVGHGSSNPSGGEPTLAFVRQSDPGGVDRVPVARLAETLARAGSCYLVALIACDLVRSSGYSAASELVKSGVSEVLALQGSIEQQCARVVLTVLLSEVLAGTPLPSAAAAARRAVMPHPHAIFPAVFRASDRSPDASELAPLSTLYARALGDLYARVSETRPMLKRQALQERVAEIVAGTGVAAVTGGFGNGSTTVLRAAVATLFREEVGRRSRPVLYLDCDRRPGNLPLLQWVSSQLCAVATAHPVLRPMSSSDFTGSPATGDELGAWAVEGEISIVLDNLPLQPTEEDKTFVAGFCAAYRRSDGRACVVLGGTGELLALADQQLTVTIPPLSPAETEQYAGELAPGSNGQELYQATGGTLLLLDAERKARTRSRRTQRVFQGGGSTVQRYLYHLEEWLKPEAYEAAARLALFPYAMDKRLAQKFVTPDLPEAIEELLDAGLAMSFEDNTITWLMIPEQKSQGIQTRRANDLARIKRTIAEEFSERYDGAANATLGSVASLAGASEYLRVVQRCLPDSGRPDIAIGLPLLAQGTALPAAGLFTLFEESVHLLDAAGLLSFDASVLDKKSLDDGTLLAVDTLLAGSRAALNVGQSEVAEQWISRIPENLDRATECRRLGLKAAILKDQRQATAVEEIIRCFSKAIELTIGAAPEEQPQLDDIRKEIEFDSLPTALFLNREPAESAARRLESVLQDLSPEEKAQLLATFAEREMKEPPNKANWSRVSEWVTDAANLIQSSSDERVRTYCAYQQAQYLRKHPDREKRPDGRDQDAWLTYQKSQAAGERAGEPRRAGLALTRMIELERDFPALRPDSAIWPATRLPEVDRVAASLRPSQSDALSMRVLGRIQAVTAGIDSDTDRRRKRLADAARAFLANVLSSEDDKRQFARVCLQALDLDLQPTGNFLSAQAFLASFRFAIKGRFGFAVDVDQPEASREAIAKWLKSHGERI